MLQICSSINLIIEINRFIIEINRFIIKTRILYLAFFDFSTLSNIFSKVQNYSEIVNILFNRCYATGCPNKHGNSVTNSTSSLLWISIAIHGIISHNIIMSARVYFMKTVKCRKDVIIMFLQDEQWRRTSVLCFYTVILLFY